MKFFGQLLNKISEEKFSTRLITILATIMSLYIVLFTAIPTSLAYVTGCLNGLMWFIEWLSDDD